MNILYAKFDGSHLPDYGKGSAGCVLYLKGEETPRVLRREVFSAKACSEAEFTAFIIALETVLSFLPHLYHRVGDIKICRIYGDSQVIFKHIRGSACTRTKHTSALTSYARSLIQQLKIWDIELEMYWVPRKCNILADTLCRTAYTMCHKPYRLKGKRDTEISKSQPRKELLL